jgi:hypothetical protein
MGWSRTTRIALVAFLVGAPVLFVAHAEWLRVVAATVLVAAIALGVFALATPAALADDPPPEERE